MLLPEVRQLYTDVENAHLDRVGAFNDDVKSEYEKLLDTYWGELEEVKVVQKSASTLPRFLDRPEVGGMRIPYTDYEEEWYTGGMVDPYILVDWLQNRSIYGGHDDSLFRLPQISELLASVGIRRVKRRVQLSRVQISGPEILGNDRDCLLRFLQSSLSYYEELPTSECSDAVMRRIGEVRFQCNSLEWEQLACLVMATWLTLRLRREIPLNTILCHCEEMGFFSNSRVPLASGDEQLLWRMALF